MTTRSTEPSGTAPDPAGDRTLVTSRVIAALSEALIPGERVVIRHF